MLKSESKKSKAKVYISNVENIHSYENVKDVIYDILDQMQGGINIPSKGEALIKLNLCLLKGPETGATVEPKVARALVEWLLERYDLKKIYLAEADATHLGADMAFKILGWNQMFCDNPKVSFLNLTNDEQVSVHTRYLKKLMISKTMMNVDFLISLAKLKTHTQQKITCIMKNQFGAIPYKYKIIYHPILDKAIFDALSVRIPDLNIVDGLIAMEGNGPTNGTPRRTKLLLASRDAVAMDHFCAKIMGFRPMTIPSLRLAAKHKLGNINYEIIGNVTKSLNLKFKFLPKWKQILKKGMGIIKRGLINEEA